MFDYNLGNTFFESFEYGLIKKGNVSVEVTLEKLSSFMVLYSAFQGTVDVECDRCLDDLSLPVEGNYKLIVKFGEGDSEESEDILMLPEKAFELDIMQYLYEYVMVSIPSKRVHEPGECNEEMLAKLNAYNVEEDPSDDIVDPRWAALKDLKNKS